MDVLPKALLVGCPSDRAHPDLFAKNALKYQIPARWATHDETFGRARASLVG